MGEKYQEEALAKGIPYGLGAQSVKFPHPVYIRESASIVGPKEKAGPFGALFDVTSDDDLFGKDTWEEAESELQKRAIMKALEKADMKSGDLRYILAGDLLGQSMASSFALMEFGVPLFGLFGACSTCGEALSVGSLIVSGGFADYVMCVTSSHFASAEKEFRYPIEYGGQRPAYAGRTCTASGAYLLSADKAPSARAKITGITTGKIMDYGIHDSFNMGCAMAPAAMAVIEAHLKDFGRKPEDYDKIITGDLGTVGSQALQDLLLEKDIDISKVHMDCGSVIFDNEKQDTGVGGSGCGCCASLCSAYVLKMLEEGNFSRVLFAPTGALLSKTSYNEGNNVLGISHAVVIERV